MNTSADSQWVLVQLGDASHQIGQNRVALATYEQYLKAFPRGTWAEWIRVSQGDADTTGEGS